MKKNSKKITLLFLVTMLSYFNSLAQVEEYDDLYYNPQKGSPSQLQDKNSKKSINDTASKTISSGQKLHFSVAISPIIPISMEQKAGIGFLSGNIGVSYDITQNISWCLNLGYNQFGTKTVTTSEKDIDCKLAYIPLTTGLKIFFKAEGTRGYWVVNGGYFLPAADFVKGGTGVSSGFGIQTPNENSKIKMDFSVLYNAAFGGTTREYTISTGQISGSTTTSFWYSYASYLTLNIGIVF